MIGRAERLKRFGSFAWAICVKTEQGDFLVDPKDNFVSRHLMEKGAYGLSEIQLVKRLLDSTKARSAVVIGAHIGSLLVPISRMVEEIFAFEANPHTYDLLHKNLLINEVANVSLFNIAVAEKTGTLEFLASLDNSGGSKRMPKNKADGYFYDQPECIEVRCELLDNVIPNKNIDLMFVDIEGSEFFAFQGGQKTLRNTNVLVTEFIPHHLKNVAGKTVEQLWSLLSPHFSIMHVPKRKLTISGTENILKKLQYFYDTDQSFDNIVLTRDANPL
jgi:FkbM family methyltransferase